MGRADALLSHRMLPYVDHIVLAIDPEAGPRGRDFDLRWVDSMVADTHRILSRGGVFLHPEDSRARDEPTRLRLLCEANAIALIVLVGMIGGSDTYFEAALLLAMVGFVSTIAYCKFILRGDIVE